MASYGELWRVVANRDDLNFPECEESRDRTASIKLRSSYISLPLVLVRSTKELNLCVAPYVHALFHPVIG